MRLPDIPADIAVTMAEGFNDDDPGHHDNVTELFENSQQFSEPKNLYYCEYCPYSNIRRDGLLSHLRCHMIRSEFRCEYCDYSVSKAHLLNQHVKIHFNLPGTDMNAEPPSQMDDKWEMPIPEHKQAMEESGDDEKAGCDEVKSSKETNQKNDERCVENEEEKMDTTQDKGNGSSESSTKNENPFDEVKEESSNKSEKLVEIKNESANVVADETDAKNTTETLEKLSEKNNKENDINGQNLNSCTESIDMEKDCNGTWICQYCDRAFKSFPKHRQHEKQHLIGVVY
jgi:hypothetical protein